MIIKNVNTFKDEHLIITDKRAGMNMAVVFPYQTLKMGKHDLPTWDGMIPVVMAVTKEKKQWRAKELARVAADSIGLPDVLRNQRYPQYPDTSIIEDRVQWALSDLAIAGLLRRPKRGLYEITELGETLFNKYGKELSANIIHAQPGYVAHREELKQRKSKSSGDTPTADEHDADVPAVSKVDKIRHQIENYNAEIAADLLERIREADPTFFEHLVADLLIAMGYQGTDGRTIVTPPSRDGGIDGIINQDPLGTSTVYYQAKRYQASNIVHRAAIQGFYGALKSMHADRGVFISTSKFSDGAREQAKNFSIVLIDGVQLTDLLLHYHVGVQAKRKYELFQIDEDYFG